MSRSKKSQNPEWKQTRPSWFLRLCATGMDVALSTIIYSVFSSQMAFAIIVIVLYYLGFEFSLGRTPGKVLLRLRFTDSKSSKLSKAKFFLRTFLRLFGPPMMLSWNRVTLLDLLSGLRVERAGAPRVQEEEGSDAPSGWR